MSKHLLAILSVLVLLLLAVCLGFYAFTLPYARQRVQLRALQAKTWNEYLVTTNRRSFSDSAEAVAHGITDKMSADEVASHLQKTSGATPLIVNSTDTGAHC